MVVVQRFGSALNLNPHFHMLLLDGVFVADGDSVRWVKVPPNTEEVQQLVTHIARTGRALAGHPGATALTSPAKRTLMTTPASSCRRQWPGASPLAFALARRLQPGGGHSDCLGSAPRTEGKTSMLPWLFGAATENVLVTS